LAFSGRYWSGDPNPGISAYIKSHKGAADGNAGSQLSFWTWTRNTANALNERMRITSDGNVGIGTTSPENAQFWAKVLDMLGSTDAKLSIRTPTIDGRVNVHESGFYGAPVGMMVGTNSSHPLSFITGGASRVTINSSGNVGIGTTSPTSGKLQILTSANGTPIYMSDGTVSSQLLNGIFGSNPAGAWFGTQSNHPIFFSVNSGNPSVTIATSGNVGIGTTGPTARLHVVDTAANIVIVATGAATSQEVFRVSNAGVVYAKGGATYGADLAEMYPAAGQLEKGEVVAVSQTLDSATGLPKVARAGGDPDQSIMGVVSDEPGLTIGWKNVSSNELKGFVPVALKGRVPVKVSLENGPIHAGDVLAASPTRPGHAMRAVRSGWVVGFALEPSRDGQSTVLCFINPNLWVSPREFRQLKSDVERLEADRKRP